MESLITGGNVLSRPNVYACANTFNSDIVRWRSLAAKLWSVLFIFVLVLVHSVTAECDGLFRYNIGSIFIGLLTHLFHLRFWLNSILIIILFWTLNSFNDKLFTVTPKVFANNIEKLIQIIYSLNFVCILTNVAFTFVITWSLLQFYDSAKINNFYVIMFCVMSNFVSRFWFIFNGNYLLKWPIIEQTKYLRFKSRVYMIALDSLKSVILHLFSWQIIFFMIGSFIFNICSILSIGQSVDLGDETTSIRYRTSANFFTILVALKLAFIINFVHMVSWTLYEIYLTEIYHFEIQPIDKTQLSLPSAMSLNQSMQVNNQRYIQTLAMIEFYDLSVNSKMKRLQLFSLNFKNGQPINWTSVSTEALNIIKGFIDIFSFDDMLHGSNARNTTTNPMSNFDSGLTSRPSAKRLSNLTSPIRSGTSSGHLGVPSDLDSNNFSTPTSPTSPGDRLRSPRSPYYVTSPTKMPASKNSNPSLAFTYSNQIFQKIIGMLKKQKLFSYIYNENTNFKNQQLIVDSFLVINALKGLANLAMYSIEEDQYGIVQQTLADILSTFMNLQKTLEKFQPTGGLSFKILQNPNANKIDLLLQKLTFVLNESTFKITQTFGSSLKSLNLPEDVAKRLQRYQLTQ